MTTISRQEALQAAIRYLGTQYERRIAVEDLREHLPASLPIYRTWQEGTVWYLIVPDTTPRIGASRLIVIDKARGQIIADQMAGGVEAIGHIVRRAMAHVVSLSLHIKRKSKTHEILRLGA